MFLLSKNVLIRLICLCDVILLNKGHVELSIHCRESKYFFLYEKVAIKHIKENV